MWNDINGKAGKIRHLHCLTAAPKTDSCVEFQMDMPTMPVGYNPFAQQDVDVSINLSSRSSKTVVTMPGFCYQEYAYGTDGGQTDQTDDPACFRMRVLLPDPGVWRYTVTLKLRGKTVDTACGRITVAQGEDTRGFVRVEPRRRQTFRFDSGDYYVPVGENIAGPYFRQTPLSYCADYYEKALKVRSEHGVNYCRIWNCSHMLYLFDHQKDPAWLNLGACHQFDKIFAAAEQDDVYISFVLFHHGQLAENPGLPEHDWHNCAFSTLRAGYLEHPTEFFTNPRAIKDTKNFLRYAVARWGYHRHILCWELFNEYDACDGGYAYEANPEWHRTMAAYLREIDPYRHLVTTSSCCYSDRFVRDPVQDFIYLHTYNYRSLSLIADLQKNDYRAFHRPVLFGEVGINEGYRGFNGTYCGKDGLELHQQHWIGLMGGGAGTCMNWFFRSTEASDGYFTFEAPAQMAKRIPWGDTALQLCDGSSVTLSHPQMRVQGYCNGQAAWLWFYDEEWNYLNREGISTFDGDTALVPLADGRYKLEWIDTFSGDVTGTQQATAKNGVLTVKMPTFKKDVALVITGK